MGGRADQLLAQRLRPTPSLHRTPAGLRRRLPCFGRRHRHHPCTAAGRMVLLPLGHPAKITTHPLTYWRTLLGEPLDEVERRLSDLPPAVVDGEGVAPVRHHHELRHGPVAPLPLVGGVRDRPRHRVVLLTLDE